jgi:hypothetical protein
MNARSIRCLPSRRAPAGRRWRQLTKLGVRYEQQQARAPGEAPVIRIGRQSLAIGSPDAIIQPALVASGYDFSKQRPPLSQCAHRHLPACWACRHFLA